MRKLLLMRITIENRADISKQYLRFLKWKIHRTNKKFGDLVYVEVFINSEGQNKPTYNVTLKLGVKGNDIVLNESDQNLGKLMKELSTKAERYLRKRKETLSKH